MSDDKTLVWNSGTTQQLAEALTAIDNLTTMANFLRDVMTEKEIIEISSRLEAARMLRTGKTYTEIVKQTKLSSRTVARISDWMQNGCSGYSAVLGSMDHQGHISPAPAG
jgi:TrpR-related protein YerC/YecD